MSTETTARWDSVRRRFDARHDELSKTRQRKLANILAWTNVAFAIIYTVAVLAMGWHVHWRSIPTLALFWALYGASLVCLGLSSGLPLVPEHILGWTQVGPSDPREDLPSLRERRKWFYYPAVYLNFAALAVVIEQTGGILHSPFTAVLFMLILAGQQLGRYTTNSFQFLIVGLILPGILLIGEKVVWSPAVEPSAPSGLMIWLLYVAFLAAAVLNHQSKNVNYAASDRLPRPEWIRLTRLPLNSQEQQESRWYYSLYEGGRRVDSLAASEDLHLSAVEELLQQRYSSVGRIAWLTTSEPEVEAEGRFHYEQ